MTRGAERAGYGRESVQEVEVIAGDRDVFGRWVQAGGGEEIGSRSAFEWGSLGPGYRRYSILVLVEHGARDLFF